MPGTNGGGRPTTLVCPILRVVLLENRKHNGACHYRFMILCLWPGFADSCTSTYIAMLTVEIWE